MKHTIVLAAGCFWGVEKYFSQLIGVTKTSVCYTAGKYDNPTYETVLQHRSNNATTNYTEAVHITYEDAIISTTTLIKNFWQLHNPTEGNKQGADIGNNYRSGIYYTTSDQKKIALNTKLEYQALLARNGHGLITTEIKKLHNTYKAEAYHQQYLAKNPSGYCPNHATGVMFDNFSHKIIVITGNNTKFQANIAQHYRGNIPIIYIKNDSTFSIILSENNQKTHTYTQDINSQDFYKLLGAFVFGENSTEFKVGFEGETDGRFCKKYHLFTTTIDGYFVDKLSGAKLFATDNRFNSGTGWLSFTAALNDSVIEKIDNSIGMQRIEIIAKISGMHLGHVFNGERGAESKRYCINASVLDFIKK